MPPKIRLHPVTTFLTLLSACLTLVTPYFLVKAVDDGLNAASFENALIWSSCAAATQIIASAINYIARRKVVYENFQLERSIRETLFSHAVLANFKSITDADQTAWPGQIITTANAYKAWLNTLYTAAVPLLIAGFGTFVVLLSLSWQLALLSFALLPVCALVMLCLRKHIRKTAADYLAASEGMYIELLETFSALIPLRALHRQSHLQARFTRACSQNISAGLAQYLALAKQNPIFDTYQALVLVAVFGAGGYLVSQSIVSVGIIVGFQIYLSRLFKTMRSATDLYAAYQEFQIGKRRASQIQSLPQTVEPNFATCPPGVVLEIKNLSFSFGENKVWNNYSLTIKEGERTSILSHSGSGKTTLARLILGLYLPESGSIALANGNSNSIGLVPQDNFLIAGSLRENIEFLSGPLTDNDYGEIITICALTKIASRSESIGLHGQKLSGGEQRRVMLARALATAPKLLIIDQMTSELDPELCNSIFSALQSLRPKLAILYLGHRSPF